MERNFFIISFFVKERVGFLKNVFNLIIKGRGNMKILFEKILFHSETIKFLFFLMKQYFFFNLYCGVTKPIQFLL